MSSLRTRTRLRIAIALAALLLVGAVLGAAATVYAIDRTIASVLDGPPEQIEARLLAFRLRRFVGLDAQQRALAEAILARDHPEVAALRRTIVPRIVEIRRRGALELRQALRPDQQVKLDQQMRLFETRLKGNVGLDVHRDGP